MLFCTVALSFFFPFITLKSLLIYNIQKRIRCKSRRDVPISLLPLFTRLLRFSRSHEIRLRSLSRDKISARTDPLWAPFSLRSRFTNIPPRSVAPAARKTECIARESRSRRFLVRPHCRFFFFEILARWRPNSSRCHRVSGHVHVHESVNPIVGWLLRQQLEEHQS